MSNSGTSTGLWTAKDAECATSGAAEGDWIASGVSIDTRAIVPGDLFTAIRGPNHDGHDHVADALAKGAAAAMVERQFKGVASSGSLLKVADTEQGLRDLAAAARARSHAKICAVTGSVGKTGTKELLSAALGAHGKVTATEGNLNNHYGLPLSLARMPADSDFGVFEMGMNHAGEISPLSKLAKPHVAIITTIAPVHIEYFDSLEGIADAKAEIFEGLEPGGTVILNRDTPYFERLVEKAKAAGAGVVWGFGVHSFANARLLAYEPDIDGAHVEASIGSHHIKYRLGMCGKHWALNSLAVLIAAQAMGVDLDVAAAALKSVMPPKGRGLVIPVQVEDGKFDIIDDTYNASPIAVRAAFDVLGGTKPGRGGRRIVVLGDMLELGDKTENAHMSLVDDIVAHDFDLAFVCGQYMANVHDALPEDMQGARACTSSKLIEKLTPHIRAGDLVLVKGSAGSHMGIVVDALRALGAIPSVEGDA